MPSLREGPIGLCLWPLLFDDNDVAVPVTMSRACSFGMGHWTSPVESGLVNGKFWNLVVSLIQTDSSCVFPLDFAADVVCCDSRASDAQVGGSSDGNAHS